MLRMILSKRTTFEFLTQWDVNLITSHINSTLRESLNGRTPYDVAWRLLGNDVLKAFQLRRIDPDKVILTPKLTAITLPMKKIAVRLEVNFSHFSNVAGGI